MKKELHRMFFNTMLCACSVSLLSHNAPAACRSVAINSTNVSL